MRDARMVRQQAGVRIERRDGQAVGRRRGSGGSDARGFRGAVPSHQNLFARYICEGAVGNPGTAHVLSLPPAYRPSCAAVHGSVVALGHVSSRVSFLEFAFEVP